MALTVATARSPQAITALLAGVDLRLPVIGLNGALISDPQTGAHLAIRTLATSPARIAIAMLEAQPPARSSRAGTGKRTEFTTASE